MDEKEKAMTKLSFSMVSSPGVYALLLGSGVSRSANIKTGWQITIDLARQYVIAKGIKTEEEVQRLKDEEFELWYVEKFGHELRYDELLKSVSKTPTERRNILNSYFEPTDKDRDNGNKIPQDAHKAIARLVKSGYIKVILTTNFDRLIEQALEEEGVVVHPLYTSEQIKGREPFAHQKPGHCYVVKINGDYQDSSIKNTPEELDILTKKMGPLLGEIFDSFGLIVCGWSAQYDKALIRTIEKISSRRYATYWIKFDSELEGKAKELVTHFDADIIQAGADDFFYELCTSVNTLSKYGQSGKVSIDVIIGKVKRNLRANNRIGLYDEINSQFSNYNDGIITSDNERKKVDTKGLNPESLEYIQKCLSNYCELVRPICSVFSNIFYYHGEGFDSRVVEGIEQLSFIRDHENIHSSELFLKTYPALLLQYSVGIVALYRNDWKLLHSISYEVPFSEYGGAMPRPSILRLTPAILFSESPGSVETNKKIIKIFLDDLYSILKDFFPTKEQFDDLFQVTEFTFSLAALQQFERGVFDNDDLDYRIKMMNEYMIGAEYIGKRYTIAHLSSGQYRDGNDPEYSITDLDKIIYKTPVYKFYHKVIIEEYKNPRESVYPEDIYYIRTFFDDYNSFCTILSFYRAYSG